MIYIAFYFLKKILLDIFTFYAITLIDSYGNTIQHRNHNKICWFRVCDRIHNLVFKHVYFSTIIYVSWQFFTAANSFLLWYQKVNSISTKSVNYEKILYVNTKSLT